MEQRQRPEESPRPQQPSERRRVSYTAPRLVRLGNVRQVTEGGTALPAPDIDGASF